MKATKYALAAVVVTCSMIWSQNIASGRVHFRISIGSPGICAYPDYWWDCYPYYGRHRGYWSHGWLGRHPPEGVLWRYRGLYPRIDGGWIGYYWSGPRLRLWFGARESWFVFCNSRSTIHDSRFTDLSSLILTKQPAVKPEDDGKTVEYFIQLRRKKSELIENARRGHKENREEAIIELAGYSLDTRVREALEEVLQSDPDTELRKQAARSISALGNRKALPILEKARAQDPDSQVRMEADKAIRKIKGH